jgi:hypothetical protein
LSLLLLDAEVKMKKVFLNSNNIPFTVSKGILNDEVGYNLKFWSNCNKPLIKSK